MKRVIVFLLAFSFSSYFAQAGINKYYVDDNAIEALITQAEVVNSPITPIDLNNTFTAAVKEDKNPWVAWALTYTAGLGICGVHRLYLGAGAGVFIGYLCTGGGFGILQTVDWVVLLIGAIENDISQYVGNKKFIMWL